MIAGGIIAILCKPNGSIRSLILHFAAGVVFSVVVAIGWYEQRMSVEKDKEAKAIMQNAQQEEMKHFGMDLEFLLRKAPKWQTILKSVLFTKGDIVELAKKGEEKVE